MGGGVPMKGDGKIRGYHGRGHRKGTGGRDRGHTGGESVGRPLGVEEPGTILAGDDQKTRYQRSQV